MLPSYRLSAPRAARFAGSAIAAAALTHLTEGV
jgi:hypothetical protein